jgi:hypothetical protein
MIRKIMPKSWSPYAQRQPMAILHDNGAVVSLLGHVLQSAASADHVVPDMDIVRNVVLRSVRLFAAQPDAEVPLGLALDAKTRASRSDAQNELLRHLKECLAEPGMELGKLPKFSQLSPFYTCQIQREASEGLLAALEARAVTLLRDGEAPLILLHHSIGFEDTLVLAQLCLADAVVAHAVRIGLSLAPGDAAARLVRQIRAVSDIDDEILPPRQFGWRMGRDAWNGVART